MAFILLLGELLWIGVQGGKLADAWGKKGERGERINRTSFILILRLPSRVDGFNGKLSERQKIFKV
jgi:hypothetical protein